jgi:hypothetical protein
MADYTLEQQRALARARARAAAASANAQQDRQSNAQAPAPVQATPALKPQSPWMPNVDVGKVATVQGANMAPQLAQMGREMALETGATTAGQAAGALMGPAAPITVPVFGGIAALIANLANQAMRKDQKGVNYGEAVSSFMAGAIPGATMAKAGEKTLLKAIKPVTREVVANMAAAETQSIMDNGRPLDQREAMLVAGLSVLGSNVARKLDDGAALKAINAERSRTKPLVDLADAATKSGYWIWPTVVNRTAPRRTLMSFADTKKLQFEMASNNLRMAENAVTKDLDLVAKIPGAIPVGTPLPITAENIIAKQRDYDAVYRDIGKQVGMSDELKLMVQSRHDAKFNYEMAETAKANAHPIARIKKFEAAGDELMAKANALENKILDKAEAIDPSLKNKFLETRKMYAKSYAVLDAIDPNVGFDPARLAKWQQKKVGQKLTDDLGMVAQMASEFPELMLPRQRVRALEISNAQGSPQNALQYAKHIVGSPVAIPLATSRPVQRWIGTPTFKSQITGTNAFTAPGMEAVLQASRAAGRRVPLNSYLAPTPATQSP